MDNRGEARKQIAEYLSWKERRKMFNLLPLKTKVKWVSLYVPGLYPVIHKIREWGLVRNVE
jgi:hypothetical protein